MNSEERKINENFNNLFARIHHEYRRHQLRLIRKGLVEGETFSSTEALVDLDDNLQTMLDCLRESRDNETRDIREGRTHEDYTECYGAMKEIKICGRDEHYKHHLSTIVDSDLPLLGKAQLLSICHHDDSEIEEILGSLPAGWEIEDEVE